MSACHICDRERDQWAQDEHLRVRMGNGFAVPVCGACWFKWPHDHKASWPQEGHDEARARWIATLMTGVRVEVCDGGIVLR
jgi:hypothetical protein